ncbi:MAG: 6-phosphogluconolactonase [Gemmatimonadetes bacterium]|uniref:6-phosphogluconolactonase n=1 Tax=Candidatus Kutchimonas denitrificans TaxID=3056748 RepID=A0AAE4ZBF1_9BACT|nr:6-phosphogluconolactonase [Gemmatimonadota bacterium]NIR75816.1 6-phosphogluconolactonase [Candidatus Kutchimonas denitrificans]NIS01984.1 6-phosphogluconolactonase [Gemmatimonadota bacterium]NIT67788.1 6-phosphogluconolactonase [Gemmatimonadota bacterium]NIU53775.1 6-phosphogluconolactonase [Gemmatimonadota bacterium]
MPDQPRVHVFPHPEAVGHAAAEQFLRLVLATDPAVPFSVVLSGGSTPRRLFATLTDPPYVDHVPWERVHLFWGDERPVPPDHPDSNYGTAASTLLDAVPVPSANVHRIPGELEPERAAETYEDELRSFFDLDDGTAPRFDLAFMGLGTDGHTASLFPGSEALAENRRLVVAPWVEKLDSYRISLTCKAFNNSAFIIFLVTGGNKAETLRQVLEGPAGRYPAQLIRPSEGELHWYIDSAAGRLLEGAGE